MIVKGPAITPNQAVKANPPISLLIGFARTWANDQINVPDKSINTPIILPSKFGLPVKIITPMNAIIIPIIFFNEVRFVSLTKTDSDYLVAL